MAKRKKIMNSFYKFLIVFLKQFLFPFKKIKEKAFTILPLTLKKKITNFSYLTFVFSLILFIFFLNYFIPRNKKERIKLNVAHNPFSVNNHLQLSNLFFQNGDLKQAKKEANIAKKNYSYLSFLDYKKTLKKKLNFNNKQINKPKLINKKIKFWETILKNKANFKDAYLNLCFLRYQIYQNKKAQTAWKKAFYLDPNNQVVKKLGKIIKKI